MVGTTETLEIESYSEKGGMAQDVSFQGRKSNKNEVVLCWLTVNYLSLHIYIYWQRNIFIYLYMWKRKGAKWWVNDQKQDKYIEEW